MTEQEIKELIKLIKENGLYCETELETNERYLLAGEVMYVCWVLHVYADEEKDDSIITLQIDIDPKDETYYLSDTSGACDKEIKDKAFPVVQYCKHLIQKYM